MENKKPFSKAIKVEYQILTWGPCVVKLKMTDEFLKILKEEGAASVDKEELGMQHRLAGILKREYKLRDYKKVQPYLNEIIQIYDQIWSKWRSHDPKLKEKEKPHKYLIKSVWVNYQGPNEFNPPHDHSDDISFTAYLQVPKEIKEEFDNFKGKSSGPGGISFLYGEGNRQAITYQSHFPEEGDLFMFPSWLKHYVAPYRANVTRISIAGSLSFQTHLKDIRTDLFKQPPEDDKKA